MFYNADIFVNTFTDVCENEALRINSWLLSSLPPSRGFDVKLYRKLRFWGETSATAAAELMLNFEQKLI